MSAIMGLCDSSAQNAWATTMDAWHRVAYIAWERRSALQDTNAEVNTSSLLKLQIFFEQRLASACFRFACWISIHLQSSVRVCISSFMSCLKKKTFTKGYPPHGWLWSWCKRPCCHEIQEIGPILAFLSGFGCPGVSKTCGRIRIKELHRITSVEFCWSNSVGSCFLMHCCQSRASRRPKFREKTFFEPEKELAYGTSTRCPNRRFCVHEPSGFRLVVGLGGGWLCFRGASVVVM